MSLGIDDPGRKGRSRSRSRDRRPRDSPDRAATTTYADVREPSHAYPEDDLDGSYKPSRRADPRSSGSSLPYPAEGGFDTMVPARETTYDSRKPVYRTASPTQDSPYRSSRDKVQSQLPGSFPDDDRRRRGDDDDGGRRVRYAEPEDPRDSHRSRKVRLPDDDDDERRVRYAEPPQDKYSRRDLDDDKLRHLPQKYAGDDDNDKLRHLPQKYSRTYGAGDDRDDDRGKGRDKYDRRDRDDDDDDRGKGRSKYDRRDRDDDDDDRGKGRGKYDRRDRDDDDDDKLKYLPQKYSRKYDDDDGGGKHDRKDARRSKGRDDDDPPYDLSSSRRDSSPPTYGSYIPGSQRDDKRSSKYAARDGSPERRSRRDDHRDDPRDDPRGSRTNVLTVEPGDRDRDRSRDRRRDKSPGPAASSSALVVHTEGRERDRSRDRRGSSGRDRSPLPSTGRMSMSSLTVDAGRPSNMSIANAPPSPLLESYHGTYQQISPMPSPLLLASNDDPRIAEPLSPLGSDNELGGSEVSKKRGRRARFHDPEDIASRLQRALKGDGPPDTETLIEILPSLTHEQVMELRGEYKRLVKTGSDRKGVNVAKHIRVRLKDEDPLFMKAAYSVSLGQWEGEAYWANFWYQGDKTRRELLIESLMGRTNEEIRRIKDAFTDKKYDNNLARCMKTELKEDKFKKAVLMVLEEHRMDETDHHGRRVQLDYALVDKDVAELHKAVRAEKGGESLMISIVIQRSDTHLRAVLKEYERQYRTNFARESLKKSGNLVGEVLAHILNGVINRPVRDALLLHHALSASRKDDLRRELLISRLVRYHWDPPHMQAVKRAYRERYSRDLQDAVREASSGEWGMFCQELCIGRVPNDVRRVERVEIIR